MKLGMKPVRIALTGLLTILVCPLAYANARSAAAPSKVVVRHGVTQPVFSYAGAIRETVYVQSTLDQDLNGRPDLLATDIIRPKETAKGLDVPVIYEMSPYYQSRGRGNEAEIKNEEDGDFSQERFPLFYDNYFVPRGYAFIAQDMRGSRNSEGCQVYGDQAELLDAQATIDWLNGRGQAFTADGQEVKADWSTGQVGMIGKSYDGSVANGAASLGVKGLETIVPISAISSWYDYHYHNGAQRSATLLTPTVFAVDCPMLCIENTTPMSSDEERGAEYYRARVGEHGACSAQAAAMVAQAASPTGDYNAFWANRDYLKDVENVKASVFLVHGLNDYNVMPSEYVPWWLALAKNDVPRKIWLGQIGHVDPFDFRRAEWVETLHRWFDFWLHDIDNGIMDEPMADVETSPGRWETYASWPIPGSRPTSLYFGPEAKDAPGVLSLQRAKEGSQSYQSGTTNTDEALISDPQTAKTNRLVFLTPKLKKNVRVSGAIEVDITASLDRTDTNFTAFLVDYGEGQTLKQVGYFQNDGIANTDKETCWGASTKADDACYKEVRYTMVTAAFEAVTRGFLDAKHYESLMLPSPIVPTQPYRFRWDLFGDDYTFKAGHRLGVVVAGNSSMIVPDPSGATVTVDLTKSRIILPVVGGAGAFRF